MTNNMGVNTEEAKKIVNVRLNKDSFIKLKHVSIDKCVSVTSIVESLIENYLTNLTTGTGTGENVG